MPYYHVRITALSDPSEVEIELDLDLEGLTKRFIDPYKKGIAILISGRTIARQDLKRMQINKTEKDSTSINADLLEGLRARNTIMPVDLRGRLDSKLLAEQGQDVTAEFVAGPPGYEVEEINPAIRQPRSTTSMRVFISHNSNDVELATLLIELLRKALRLSSEEIRCTSVDGYRMQAGAPIDERLRAEVHDAELLIGLITPNSLGSAYVFFELGARWGAGKHMIPLLASGVTPEQLEGPLAGINALNSSVDSQVHQFLEDAAKHLNLSLDKASSYAAAVNEMVRVASESTAVEERLPITPEHPRLSEEAKQLLIEATKSSMANILRVGAMGGLIIQANGKNLCERGNPRSEAIWEGALKDLIIMGFVEDQKGKGEVFVVTREGFQAANDIGNAEQFNC